MGLDLAVVRFSSEGAAAKRYAAARDGAGGARATGPQPQWARHVGLVERHHSGRLLVRGTFAGHYVDVDEADDISEKGGREGAAAGGLIGVLGGPPGIAVGLLLGSIVGAEVGHPKEVEDEPEALVAALREAVPRSSSAIVMIAQASEVDEMLAALGDDGKDIVRRTLSGDETRALEASLGAAPHSP
jgi:uncharacterized membrane protein